jgi:stress-induced morphogen
MPVATFDYKKMSKRTIDVLRSAFGPNAAVRTDPGGESGKVFVRIVSDKFDGRSETEKQQVIWDTLKKEMKEDSQAVALVLAFGTDQV